MPDVLFAACAFLQGWTSTAWVVANAKLVPRHGGAVFTTAISHIFAWLILMFAASIDNWRIGLRPSALLQKARGVPWKLAWIMGLGWTSTLFLVSAAHSLGAALAQVLVLGGELSTAVLADAHQDKSPVPKEHGWLQVLLSPALALLGVTVSLAQELISVQFTQAAGFHFFLVALGAFFCGACLVLNSVGNTHLREHIGPLNASAWSAFMASLGNVVICVTVEVFGFFHFQEDTRPTTLMLWAVVGFAGMWVTLVVTFVPPRIGFARTFCLIVAGKVTGGLFVDALGLMSPGRPVTLLRALGALLVLLAALQRIGSQKQQHGHVKSENVEVEVEVAEATAFGRRSSDTD
ncbi:unnamed protein product [Effrenium voratum]|uniref:Uncharacterized protein n=1 Tax=Effrenium voratum TaxID=2562239 RepID=A0AA36NEI8_9DINO|nr:unnamed protein product [Effrenium voratum]CAJ1448308.1 unnamed protein product [Effrenium voratum]